MVVLEVRAAAILVPMTSNEQSHTIICPERGPDLQLCTTSAGTEPEIGDLEPTADWMDGTDERITICISSTAVMRAYRKPSCHPLPSRRSGVSFPEPA